MARLKFIGLFTLSHGSNRNEQGRHVPLCGLWRQFHVAGWNFEEILQHFKKKKEKPEKIFWLIECDGWLFVCAKLA